MTVKVFVMIQTKSKKNGKNTKITLMILNMLLMNLSLMQDYQRPYNDLKSRDRN